MEKLKTIISARIISNLIVAVDNVYSPERSWCVEQLMSFESLFIDRIRDYSNIWDKSFMIWFDEKLQLTEDNNRFYRYIDDYKNKLIQVYPNFFKDLHTIEKIINDGAIIRIFKYKTTYRAYFQL